MKQRLYHLIKNKFLILVLFIMSFSNTGFCAEFTCKMPKETAVLQLPDHSESNWKEIARYVSAKDGVIEVIPLNQNIQNWSELIAVQYGSSAEWDKAICDLEYIVEHLRKETLSSYPKGTASWQIIEKDNEGIIYEWSLNEPYNDIPIQHEVARAFLTPSGFHRVGFTRKNNSMSPEERAKWIQILRENTSVVLFHDASSIEGISMVERLKDSVSVGTHFCDWKKLNPVSFETGFCSACYIPPTQWACSYVTECLEIHTSPNVKLAPLSTFFEIEKICVQNKTSQEMKFHILEQSPNEIIYFYCHPQGLLHLNAVVRVFLTDYGYYSISHKKELVESQIQEEEMRSWMEKLKTIHVGA